MTAPRNPLPMLVVLRAVETQGKNIWGHLTTRYPSRQVWRKARDLEKRGYVTLCSGGSPTKLTDKGRAYLKAARSPAQCRT